MLFLLPVGNVLPKSCDMQAVRVTSEDGGKLFGILNATRTAQGTIEELYVDLGFDSEEEARAQGVAEGAMVTFATDARMLAPERVAGKALDDRAGCTALVEACRTMASDAGRKNDLYFAFTSSEEVGTRGGRTVTELVEPDLIVAIDTANHAELDRGFKNHRQLGEGFMLEHYDKTMSPNRKLLRAARRLFETGGLAFQRDMFGGGGTDAGAAHLAGGGRLCLGAWHSASLLPRELFHCRPQGYRRGGEGCRSSSTQARQKAGRGVSDLAGLISDHQSSTREARYL